MADPMTPERLDELVDIDPLQIRDAAVSLLTRAETAEAEVERLRAELADGMAAWRTAYERLSRQVLRRHWAWQSAKRGRALARKRLRDLATIAAQRDNFAEQMRNLKAERDRLAEQVERDRASIIRLAQSWARRGKGAVAAELLTEFEIDEGEILGEAGR